MAVPEGEALPGTTAEGRASTGVPALVVLGEAAAEDVEEEGVDLGEEVAAEEEDVASTAAVLAGVAWEEEVRGAAEATPAGRREAAPATWAWTGQEDPWVAVPAAEDLEAAGRVRTTAETGTATVPETEGEDPTADLREEGSSLMVPPAAAWEAARAEVAWEAVAGAAAAEVAEVAALIAAAVARPGVAWTAEGRAAVGTGLLVRELDPAVADRDPIGPSAAEAATGAHPDPGETGPPAAGLVPVRARALGLAALTVPGEARTEAAVAAARPEEVSTVLPSAEAAARPPTLITVEEAGPITTGAAVQSAAARREGLTVAAAPAPGPAAASCLKGVLAGPCPRGITEAPPRLAVEMAASAPWVVRPQEVRAAGMAHRRATTAAT